MRFPRFPRWSPKVFAPSAVLILLVVGALLVYGKPESSAAQSAAKLFPYPAALVGPRIVLAKSIFLEVGMVQTFSEKTGQAVPPPGELRSQVLEKKIEIALAKNELASKNEFVSWQLVNAQVERLSAEQGGVPQVEKVLRDLYGVGIREFRTMVAEQLAFDLLRDRLLSSVSVRHILVAEEGEANDIVKQLNEGKDFAELAKTYSKDAASKDNGGDLGWVYRGQFQGALEEAVFGAELGQVAGPIQTDLGWEIIRVDDKRGVIDKSYEVWLSDAKSSTKTFILLRR